MYRRVSSCLLKIMVTYPPPPTPYISEMAFSHRFQKVYIYPTQGNDISAHRTKSSKTLGKRPKPTELAHNECPREIWEHSSYCSHLGHRGKWVQNRGGTSPRFCTRPPPSRSGLKAPGGGGGGWLAAEESFSGGLASRWGGGGDERVSRGLVQSGSGLRGYSATTEASTLPPHQCLPSTLQHMGRNE